MTTNLSTMTVRTALVCISPLSVSIKYHETLKLVQVNGVWWHGTNIFDTTYFPLRPGEKYYVPRSGYNPENRWYRLVECDSPAHIQIPQE